MNGREKKLFGDMVRNASASRVVLERSDDQKKMQAFQVKGLSGEVLEDVEYFQPYGFTSRPPRGSEALAFPVGGDRGHLVAMNASDRAVRKKEMEEGEVGVYHQNGDFFYLKDGNKIETQTKESTTNAEDKAVTNTREFEANASQTAQMRAGQVATVSGGTNANVTAPMIGLMGAILATDQNGNPTTARFKGNVYIEGTLDVLGNVIVSGDVNVGGDVAAGGDVTAGGVSLRGHIHPGVQRGGAKTDPPEGGGS
ncbi:phage baseplate assembly protein [Deltaproteobacteria bacterium OttesenSCG-928-M10]|nr:phage baseplate assembly protein [Deltaproteobacteria bacterium OttesenSCG-928-M10]